MMAMMIDQVPSVTIEGWDFHPCYSDRMKVVAKAARTAAAQAEPSPTARMEHKAKSAESTTPTIPMVRGESFVFATRIR